MELASLKESLDASTAKAIAHNQEIAKLEVSIKEGDLTKEKLEAEVVALKAAAKDAEALSAAYARLQEDVCRLSSPFVCHRLALINLLCLSSRKLNRNMFLRLVVLPSSLSNKPQFPPLSKLPNPL
jgi:chromosome segregation ATPase